MSEWREIRAKHLYRVVDERARAGRPPLLAVSIHRGVVPRTEITDDEPRADDLSAYKVVRSGDIVLNRMRAFQGAVGISPSEGLVSPDYIVLRPTLSDARFLHYLFRSRWFVGEMIARLRGIGSAETGSVRTPRINADDLGDIALTAPALSDQSAIAEYLDVETDRIDALIRKKRRLIELLDERMTALIDDLTAVLPDQCPLKRVARISYGLGQPPLESLDGVAIVRATNINRGEISEVGLMRAALSEIPLERAPLLREGEILVVRSGALTGDSARITSEWAGSAPGYDLRVTPSGSDSRLLAWQFLGRRFLDQVDLARGRAAQPHLNAEDLSEILVRRGSWADEQRFADLLDERHGRWKRLHAKLSRQADLLVEHRDALITGAVTGEFAVPGVAA